MPVIECPKCEAKFSEPTLECPECGAKISEPARGSGEAKASAEMPKSVLRVAKKAVDLLVALDDKCFPGERQPTEHPEEAKDSATTRDLETVRWPIIVVALVAGLVPLTFFLEPPYTQGFVASLASLFCRVLSGVVVGCFVAAAISHFRTPLLSWGPRRWWHVALFAEAGWGLLTGTFVSALGFIALPLVFLALALDHPTVQALAASTWAKLQQSVKSVKKGKEVSASTSSGTEDPTEETGNQKGILEILKENKGKLLGTPMVIVMCVVFFSSPGEECSMNSCQLPGDYGLTHKYESCNYYHALPSDRVFSGGVWSCPQWQSANKEKRYCRQCAGYWADGGRLSYESGRIGNKADLGVIRHPKGKASRTPNLFGIPWYVWIAATVGHVMFAITRARHSKPAGNGKSPEE